MPTKPTFFHYAKCSTCVKARKFLEAKGVAVDERPIVERAPTVAELKDLHKRSGLPLSKFFNTSGQSYRALGKEKISAASEEEKFKLLAADGKLVKRPILDDGKTVLVGFDEEAYGAWVKG